MSTASWFSRALLPWYRENRRDLPWRRTTDPYRIWLSEVILQQTRVDQGLAYWKRCVKHYPRVRDLAAAPEDEVLKLWQGLGYYRRARNLLAAAKQVVDEHDGKFPQDHKALMRLKGVGDYTASAIASICFGLPEPVVDGNVYRVLSRAFGIATPIDSTAGRKEFRTLAATLLDREEPGDHNQAVMELGATVCTPRSPRCGECPLARKCIARATDRAGELPVKQGRTTLRTRYFNYLHIVVAGRTYLRKRTGKDIWQGLYEFPLIESKKVLSEPALLRAVGMGWKVQGRQRPVKHVLSHQVIMATFWQVLPPAGSKAEKDWVAVKPAALHAYAVPRLIEWYVENSSAKAR